MPFNSCSGFLHVFSYSKSTLSKRQQVFKMTGKKMCPSNVKFYAFWNLPSVRKPFTFCLFSEFLRPSCKSRGNSFKAWLYLVRTPFATDPKLTLAAWGIKPCLWKCLHILFSPLCSSSKWETSTSHTKVFSFYVSVNEKLNSVTLTTMMTRLPFSYESVVSWPN